MNLKGLTIKIGDQEVPFGTDLVFCGDGIEGFTFAAEICEDFWAPTPPSTTTALAGAHILCNLSASPITIGKSRRSEEHTSELQSLMRISYAVFCLKKKKQKIINKFQQTTNI